MADVEIRVKLKLDNAAAGQLKNVKQGFTGARDAAKNATQAAAGFVKQVAAVALGTYLPRLIGGVKDMTAEWLGAANAAYDQEQALAGIYATMGDLNKSWGTARKQAEGMRRSLLDMAIEIGQAPKDVEAGYNSLIRQIGKGTDASFQKARTQTEQLTVLANVMGFNVEQLAAEFGGMHKGVLRMRGPLVDILRQTGVFGDNIAEAVGEWRKLSDVQRETKLAEALKLQADRIGKATPTISDLINTFGGMKQLFLEELGAPVIRHMIPVLDDLKGRLKAARPAIERLAKTMSKDVVKWVEEASSKMSEGFKYLKTHGAEIKADLKEAAATIKEAFTTALSVAKYIVQNKEAIAAAWGGSKVLGAMGGSGGAMKLGRGIAGAGPITAKGAKGAIQGAAGGAGMAGMVAGMAGLAALTAAVMALGAAAYQAARLIDETSGARTDKELNYLAQLEAAREEAYSGDIQRARELTDEVARGSSVHREAANALKGQIEAQFVANKEIREQILVATAQRDVAALIQSYNAAVDSGNTAMIQLAGKTLVTSGWAVENFATAQMQLTGGIDQLRTAVGSYARDFKSEMDSIKIELMLVAGEAADKAKAGEKATEMRAKAQAMRGAARGGGGGVSVNVDKMEIKQEFRQADPNRVILAFKKDIVRRASRRVQSKRATVFGM